LFFVFYLCSHFEKHAIAKAINMGFKYSKWIFETLKNFIGKMSKSFHKLAVKNLTKETPDSTTLTFDIPAELKDKFQYTQGQYLTLKTDLNGQEIRRSYSMCSSPLEADLSVTVKKVPGGKMSTHLHQNVKVGDVLEVMEPAGRFYTELHADNKKNYYLVGAGSGITPLMSILKTILEKEPMSFVFLLYGNRNEDYIIFNDELDQLQKRYQGQLHVTHILSQPKREKKGGIGGLFSKGKINWTGKTGRIDGTVMKKFLQDQTPRHKDSEFFLCGPGGMIDSVKQELLAEGFDKKNIHREYFTVDEPTTTSEGFAGAKAIVTLDGKKHEVTVPKGKHILTALMDNKVDAPYSCTSGACSTCMAKLTKGSVKMDACYALDDSEVENGFILTCQSHPTTEVVELTFDV